MRVVFSARARAEDQLLKLYDYIEANASPAIAESYVNRIVTFCKNLEKFPKRGTLREDIGSHLRVIGFQRRVTIAFGVHEERKRVVIYGVFYGGQSLPSDLHEETDL